MATRRAEQSIEKHPLTPEQLAELKTILEKRRMDLLQSDDDNRVSDNPDADGGRPSDEVDLASAEYGRAFEHRIKDRDRKLLKKVETVIQRIEDGEYDECATCGNYIGAPRLFARPEATLCIECKEEQEQLERQYHKRPYFQAPFTLK